MAGHSKWANIKHRKGAQDKKRAKIFTRILKEVHIAVKEAQNPDPESNPKLRLAISNAKGANIPKDTIERAINKASGADSESFEDLNFEGYLPHGVAVFVEASTDNHQRTVANVRSIFNKTGGHLGVNGSVEFLFDHVGVFTINREQLTGRDKEATELALIQAGAEEMEKSDDYWIVTTTFEDFGPLQHALEEMKLEAESASLQRIPKTETELTVEESLQILQWIERFEDDDDVQNVYHNLAITPAVEEALNKETN